MQASLVDHLKPYHPTTFLERGVAVPFTTPMLIGARARPTERNGMELILPNPSGGPGAYILPWNSLRDLCRPTLHDNQLCEQVAALPTITPSGMRAVARSIAAEGLAGHAARDAVARATEHENQDRLLTNFLLLLSLVRQGEPQGSNLTPPEREKPAVLEARAKRVIALLAPRLGLTAERIAVALEQLSAVLNPIGISRNLPQARFSRAIAALTALRDAALAWSQGRIDDTAPNAAMIADVAGLTLSCAAQTIVAARALVDDLPMLLRRWDADPRPVVQLAARPDWLLDGWEHICLIWSTAETDIERHAALAEIALAVPVIPREVVSWLDGMVLPDDTARYRRNVRINHDWRTGLSVFDMIARNERIRAMAA